MLGFEFLEEGPDIKVQMSESLASITPLTCSTFIGSSRINLNDALINMRRDAGDEVCKYALTSGPVSWNGLDRFDADASTFTGVTARLWGEEERVDIFKDYIPGAPLAASFLKRCWWRHHLR
jgi:hypothetical protein